MPIEAMLLGAVACLGTNVDNLIIVMGAPGATRRAGESLVFLGVLAGVTLLALAISQSVEYIPSRHIRWVGLLPLGLGLLELWKRSRPDAPELPAAGLGALALVLASNSGDTLLAQTAVIADSAEQWDLGIVAGALVAGLLLALLTLFMRRSEVLGETLLPVLQRLQPWIMIAIGLFILADTPLDVQ